MQPVGRDRRRKGPVNRVRRFLYGLLLAAAVPGAAAADELAYVGKFKPQQQTAAAAEQVLEATIQGIVLFNADLTEDPGAPIQGNAYPRISLDTVTARIREPAAAVAPIFRIAVSEGGAVRDGVGFDLAVPDLANFHLNLYARRNAKTEGKRWAVDVADGESGHAAMKTWSLGGSLEVVRTVDGGRHVALVPELLVDLRGRETRYLPFQASLKYANWRSLADKRSLDEQVAQLTFKWRL